MTANCTSKRISILTAATVGLATYSSALGLTATWTGAGTTANWSDAGNWSGGSGAGGIPGAGDTLSFGAAGVSGTTLNDDLGAGFSIGGIIFTSTAPAYTFGGNSIALLGTTANPITNQTTLTQTIGNALSFTAGSFNVNGGTSGTVAFTGILSGNQGVSFGLNGSSGNAAVSGANTFTGTVAIGSAATVTVSTIGSYVTGNVTPSNLGSPTTSAAATVTMGGSSLNGTLKDVGTGESTNRLFQANSSAAGANGIIDQSGTGALVLTGAGNTFNAISNVALANTRTSSAVTHSFTLQGSTAGTGEVAGAIVDSSLAGSTTAIIKAGTGTWTLSNSNNNYTGGTTINGGKLRLVNTTTGGTSETGTGAVALSGGTTTTLAGNGTSIGALTVTAGSRLAPGINTSGTNGNFGVADILSLGTTGGMTLTSANADFDLATTAAGTNDLILTGGTLNVTSLAFTFNELGASLDTTNPYTLISGFSALGSLPAGITGSVVQGGYTPTFSLNPAGTALQVTFTAAGTPEPASLALIGLAGLVAGGRRRRV